MNTNDSYALIGTGAAARRLGVHRRTILWRIDNGRLTPACKLPGPLGGYLFDAEQIDRLAEAQSKAGKR